MAAQDLAALVEGNAAFAFDLYRALTAPGTEHAGGNLFYSPYSISVALALAYAGASGETQEQMAETLRLSLAGEALHRAVNALDLRLTATSAEGEASGFRLRVANAVWGQADHGFLPAYLELLARHYGETVREADFAGAPEQARLRINAWVQEETQERIRELVPAGAINASTRLVLANAVSFSAAWASPFAEAQTAPGPFHLLDGAEREVAMMRQEGSFGYLAADGYQALRLPYTGGAAEMIVVVPDRGRFAELEAALDGDLFGAIVDGLEERPLALSLPRFGTESAFSLAETLARLGMPAAFDGARAEFAGVDGRSCLAGDAGCLLISDVLHQAFLSVDERGTEAAAATAVLGLSSALPPADALELAIDRPFIVAVRHAGTGALLFLGRMLDPK